MLEAYQKPQPKPKTVLEFKDTLQRIWTALPQKSVAKGVKQIYKRLEAACQLMEGIFNIKFDHWHNGY